MDKTLPSNRRGASSIPGQADKIPHAKKPKHKNSNNIITNSIKTLKMVYVKKKKTGLRWIDNEQVFEQVGACSGGDTRASWLEGWEVI